VLLLGLGQPPREFIEIAGADEFTLGEMARWHRPVLTGEPATPDQPPRILALELLESSVIAGPAVAGAHAENQPVVNVTSSAHAQCTD
jgi:hypothetical protein